ncbi:MAG TPA: arginine--tRNA ligase [Armatimonadota bacterium]|nr:arginine--tRNA ligase [Armatimonadota bacterium]
MQDMLRTAIADAIAAAVADESLPELDVPEFTVEEPPRQDMGDFACNVAMMLAKPARKSPRDIAQIVIDHIPELSVLDRVEIAGPGFLNLYVSNDWLYVALRECIKGDGAYGRSDIGAGQKIQVEFVSANPVGPLHIGNARGGPYGDVLASIFEFCGYEVEREYYVNDGRDNTQLQTFGRSIRLRYLELLGETIEFPEDLYQGDYVVDFAQRLLDEQADALRDLPDEADTWVTFADIVVAWVLESLKADLGDFGIEFDVWFSERTLHDKGAVLAEIDRLVEMGVAYEKDGAIWLKTQEHGDDEDRVLIRQGGAPTYIASDLAYARDKYARGADKVIYVWGPDHAGYVPRMRAAVEAIGIDLNQAEFVISQIVRFLRDGEVVRLSKRKGSVVTLRSLMDEIGRDAARFHFLMRTIESHMDFDLTLAGKQANENPVFYVQYAHTRTCGVLRKAENEGFQVPAIDDAKLELLEHPDELALLRKISDFPGDVEAAAATLGPHRLTTFAREISALFHQFYTTCRVMDPAQPELTGARLCVVKGTRVILATICRLLGITAPETM